MTTADALALAIKLIIKERAETVLDLAGSESGTQRNYAYEQLLLHRITELTAARAALEELKARELVTASTASTARESES